MYFSFARFLILEEWLLLETISTILRWPRFAVIARDDAFAVETEEDSRIAAEEPADMQIDRANWIPDL
jgi:hypothetical protein